MASPSPVTDGQRVIVHFGNGDLASYTFDGHQEWKRNLTDDYGPYTIWWGHANSPILIGDEVDFCLHAGFARRDRPRDRSELRRRSRQAHGQAALEGDADDRRRRRIVRLVYDSRLDAFAGTSAR